MNVSEKHIASIFSPEEQHRHLHRRENLKIPTNMKFVYD
jgi:hypothetical protein